MDILQRRTLFKMAAQAIVGAIAFNNSDAEKPKPKKPTISIRLSPRVGFAPAKVHATVELKGGDDSEDFHCLGIILNWADGSKSVRYSDCDPFDETTKIQRLWTAEHRYPEEGEYNVTATLFRGDKIVAQISSIVVLHDGIGSSRLGEFAESAN